MAKIVFGMMQSLDGYVAGVDGALEPPLHSPPGAALLWICDGMARSAEVDCVAFAIVGRAEREASQ